jgi:hypothetical protein
MSVIWVWLRRRISSCDKNIVKDIRGRGNSLTAGDIGYRYLLNVLDDAGRSDVIYDMNSRADVPGYGYQLRMVQRH